MASLFCPPLPPANLRTFKGTIAASAAADAGKKTPSSDATVGHKVLMPSGPKRPWWAPLFRTVADGRGSDRTAGGPEDEAATAKMKTSDGGGSEGHRQIGSAATGVEANGAKRRSAMTAEKARVLRREMRATETWHDAMYHSVIANRLASPDDEP